MLILNAADVRQSLPMAEAIDAMKRAMISLSSGHANIPLRTHLHLERSDGTTLIMGGHVDDPFGESLVVKVVSIFNRNNRRGLPNILGIVNVLDPETGEPIAILDGSAVTAIRTAATSGAATEALANSSACQLAIIGSGTQAGSHFHAMCAVRPIERAMFYAPNRDKVEALMADLETDIELVVAESSAEATMNADIVCATTNSSTPVIVDDAIKSGCHINAIGSYKPEVVEIPAATIVRSRVFVDHLASALGEAGDLIQPIERGEISRDHIIGEIGQLFSGEIAGRRDGDEITLFKSVGNTVEDVVAARVIVDNARKQGLGQQVEF